MDGLSFPSVRILMHDSDHWSSLGGNDTSTSDDRYYVNNNLMIVDASNINISSVLEDDAYVISSDTNIGASINKCSGFARSVSRNRVANGSYVYRVVLLAVDNDKFCIG
jgi:hypothetical protein